MVFIGEPFKNSDLEEVQNENFSLGQVGDVSVRLWWLIISYVVSLHIQKHSTWRMMLLNLFLPSSF